jgi:hypothetical protein
MNLEKGYEKFLATAGIWEKSIEDYDDLSWNAVPSFGGWTLAQVYRHVVDATRTFGFDKIEKCAERSDGRPSRTWPGRLVFLLGSIPPVRARVPGDGTYAPEPISREDARLALADSKRRMVEIMPLVRAARGVATHPALGRLTAEEWYRFLEMHMRHHLRQKKRIDAALALRKRAQR